MTRYTERSDAEIKSMAEISQLTIDEFLEPMAKEITKVSREMSSDDDDYLSSLAASMNMAMHRVMTTMLLEEPELVKVWPHIKLMLPIALVAKFANIDGDFIPHLPRKN